MMLNTQQNLTRRQAAEWLTAKGYPTAKTTLDKLATIGGSPTYRIFGNRAIYTTADLLEWAEARLSAPVENTAQREVI